MQRTPMTAQNVLPVIEDPVIMLIPWPPQTTPVRNRTAPTTRLAMVTNEVTRARRRPVCRRSAGPAFGSDSSKMLSQGCAGARTFLEALVAVATYQCAAGLVGKPSC